MYKNLKLNAVRLNKMSHKAVDTYASAIEFVPEWHQTEEMCNKEVVIYFLGFGSIPD